MTWLRFIALAALLLFAFHRPQQQLQERRERQPRRACVERVLADGSLEFGCPGGAR